MKLGRFASYVFFGSLFSCLILWGYFPGLWVRSWVPVAVLGLALAGLVGWFVFSLGEMRLWLKKRSTQFALSLVFTALAALVLLGSLNWLATTYNKKWDLTKNQFHTLSDQTRNLLGGLKEPITIRLWTSSSDRMSANLDVRRFLENYKIAGKGKVAVEIKNPNEDPQNAKLDNLKRDHQLIVKAGSGREARVENFSDMKGEEQLTNAIVQALKGQKKTVCFLAGHGEKALGDSGPEGLSKVKGHLANSFYDAKEIVLATSEKMPADCESVVIAGPRSEAIDREMQMLKGYLDTGGKMIAMFGPGTPDAWRVFAANYGVKVRTDLILDPQVSYPIYVATKNYAQDVEIVKAFDRAVIFPETSSIDVASQPANGETIRVFVSSESRTFAKAGDLRTLKGPMRLTGSDLRGPLPVAVLVSKLLSNPNAGKPVPPTVVPAPGKKPKAKAHGFMNWIIHEAYAQDDMHGIPGMPAAPEAPKDGPKVPVQEMSLILFSNSNFIANSFLDQYGNMDLFLNAVNFLMKDQDLIGIRPREIRKAQLEISMENIRQVSATVFLLAAAFLLGGIMAKRRKSTGEE